MALFVVVAGIAFDLAPRRAAFLGLAAWFGAQAVVAVWGIASGTVGGVIWLAVIADPLIALWFLLLAKQPASASSAGSAPDRSPEIAR